MCNCTTAPCNATRIRGWQRATTPWLRQCAVAKIFPFSSDPNQMHIQAVSFPLEGRIAIVTDVERDAVDARASGAHGNRRAR
jgi:hypothetical protein